MDNWKKCSRCANLKEIKDFPLRSKRCYVCAFGPPPEPPEPPENPLLRSDGEVKHWSVAGLLHRGWTKAMIEKYLGEPDKTSTNSHYRSAAPMRLYSIERVLEAEHRVDVQKRIEQAIDRRRSRVQAKLKAYEVDLAAYWAKRRAMCEPDAERRGDFHNQTNRVKSTLLKKYGR